MIVDAVIHEYELLIVVFIVDVLYYKHSMDAQ